MREQFYIFVCCMPCLVCRCIKKAPNSLVGNLHHWACFLMHCVFCIIANISGFAVPQKCIISNMTIIYARFFFQSISQLTDIIRLKFNRTREISQFYNKFRMRHSIPSLRWVNRVHLNAFILAEIAYSEGKSWGFSTKWQTRKTST